MIIEIIKCDNKDLWYSDSIGRRFYAFVYPSMKYFTFINFYMFVLNSDIKILKK